MTTARYTLQVTIIALAALVGCAVILAYIVSVGDSYQPHSSIGLTASGLAGFFGSLFIGTPFVLLYGVPVFVVLSRCEKASWRNVLVAAIIPAAIVALFSPPLAVLVFGFSMPVAVLVRWLAGGYPNHIFNPDALKRAG